MNHVRMPAAALVPVILQEDENTDDDKNIADIQRWEHLVLKQHRERQKGCLWSAIVESRLAHHCCIRARLSETDRGRDGNVGTSSSGTAGGATNDARDETAV